MSTDLQTEASEPQDDFTPRGTLLLTRQQVADLLDLDDCIAAVEAAHRADAEGQTIPPDILGAHVEGGGFHLKTAGLLGPPAYFAAKLNGNFFDNGERFGLPRIQGLIVLCDARNGYPLAVMDSTEITAVRTAAATAVAAKYLAREDSNVATICGCGVQGREQLKAVCRVRPIETVYAFDAQPLLAERFAETMADALGVEIAPTEDLAWASRQSHICITCTPSQSPLLGIGDVAPGAFVAAVGADSEVKQEIDPELLAASRVVVDHLEQCATIGDLHHALERGALEESDVVADLSATVAGQRPVRRSDEEVIVFDSTGVALQDVAAAALVFERARDEGAGTVIEIL